MDTLAGIVVIVGVVASAVAWHLVARGRDVWRTMPPLYVTLGLVAVLLASSLAAPFPGAGRSFTIGFQLGFGLLTGAVLFVATRVFVALAGRSATFARHTRDAYRRADTVSVARAIALSVFVVAVGEELFWRGLVSRVGVDQGVSAGSAAAIAWLLYVVANRASRLLPIIAAAAVGGALWATLAWWTGGVLASIASHMLWTGLMLGFPPGPPRAEVT
jgi:membrane protease YdiL (CAAX protease family)